VNSRRGYRETDDPPKIVGDKGFVGFMSSVKPNAIPENVLYNAVNARIENGEIETRKGSDVQHHEADFKASHYACRYVNPVKTTTESATIALAHNDNVTLYDPDEQIIKVPYQSGQVANGDAELVESFGSLFLTRGGGAKLPCSLPAKLGEYPLEYDGQAVADNDIEVGDLLYVKVGFWGITKFDQTNPRDDREFCWVEASDDVDPQYPKLYEVTHIYDSGTIVVKNEQGMRTTRRGETATDPNGIDLDKVATNVHFHYNDNHKFEKANPVAGVFKMPNASVIIQIYPWSRNATQQDVKQGRADYIGETINECRADLAPIESMYDQWFFNSDNVVTGSALNSSTGHSFKDGETIKIQGTTNHNGTWEIKRHDFNTIILLKAPIPTSAVDQNGGGRAWNESSYLRPADFAVTTANRLAYKSATDLVQFSDVFAPTIANPFFNRVLVNEGTGDEIIAMLPVQDDSLLVFKRNSIYLITATSTLGENLRVIEITRQIGCAARGSIQEIGNIVYFLSDNGIYAVDSGIRNESNIASPIKALEIIDKPLSDTIQDKIDDINFKYADKFISAYANNRYYLGVVSSRSVDGNIDKIIVYNQLIQKFESVDEIPDDLKPKQFVVIPVNGKNTLHLVTEDSQILSYETSMYGVDTYFGSGQLWTEANILFSITSRHYDAETFNLKRWHRLGVTAQCLENTAALGFGLNMQNPDKAVLMFNENITDKYRKVYKVIARQRSQLLSVTINNLATPSFRHGRLRISEIYAEGSECARSSRNWSNINYNEKTDLNILVGTRPTDQDFEEGVIVGDPSLRDQILVNSAVINWDTKTGDQYYGLALSGTDISDGAVAFMDKGVRKWINLTQEGIAFVYSDEEGNSYTDLVPREETTVEYACPGGYSVETQYGKKVCQWDGTGIYLAVDLDWGAYNMGGDICPAGTSAVTNINGDSKCHPEPAITETTTIVNDRITRSLKKIWEDIVTAEPSGYKWKNIEGMITIIKDGDYGREYLTKAAAPWKFN
jgi:hypothetical protein